MQRSQEVGLAIREADFFDFHRTEFGNPGRFLFCLLRDPILFTHAGQELFPEIGMSYLDQFQGPFSDALTAQCRDPVFGHNVMHIPTGGDDPPEPSVMNGTILETLPFFAVEGRAMMGQPSRLMEAPRMKSTCPPMPLKKR